MEGTTLILQVTCLSAGDYFINNTHNKLVAYASSVKVGDITA